MDLRCVTDAYTSLYGINKVYQTLSLLSVLELNNEFTPAPPHTFVHDVNEFMCDYIIVGAGASGSLIANRLSENTLYQVCVIEAGGDSPFEASLPGLFPYRRREENMWNQRFTENVQSPTFHKLRIGPLDLGKGLGGSSNVDRYLYERGNPEDYDEWARIVDDETWNHDNVLQAFIKTEALYDDEINNSEIYSKYHGTTGNLGVSKQYCDRTNEYLEAFKEIGHQEVIDFSEGRIGYGRPFLTVANETHQTAAYSFLSSIVTRPNLKFLKHSTVVKITIDSDNNADGVCFVDRNHDLQCIKARKEVILAAGAIHTPKLLMQSGIGPKNHLEEKHIAVLSNLPVGRNLIHHSEIMTFHQTGRLDTSENLGPYVFPDPVLIGRLPEHRTISSIVSPTLMLEYCYTGYKFAEDVCQYFYEQTLLKDIMITGITQFKPKSRGSIELKSSNYEDELIIQLGFDSYDLDRSIEYVKSFERIYQSTYFRSVQASQLKVSRCYQYIPGSDAYYRCFVRGMRTPTGDLSGTCAMGSVVDTKLRVYRINGLRVVDASVIPIPISGGLYATTLMIAERAAEIIINADRNDENDFEDDTDESNDSNDSDDSDETDESSDSSDDECSDESNSSKRKKCKDKKSKEKKSKEKKSKEKKSKENKSE